MTTWIGHERGKKQTFFDPLPPSSCPCSYWMSPYKRKSFIKVAQRKILLYKWLNFGSTGSAFNPHAHLNISLQIWLCNIYGNPLILLCKTEFKKNPYSYIHFQMSNLTITILHAKHANLLNLAILKLQKQPCFCSCVKFIYSEKATKLIEISTNYLTGST